MFICWFMCRYLQDPCWEQRCCKRGTTHVLQQTSVNVSLWEYTHTNTNTCKCQDNGAGVRPGKLIKQQWAYVKILCTHTPISQHSMTNHRWRKKSVDYLLTAPHAKAWDILDSKWTICSPSMMQERWAGGKARQLGQSMLWSLVWFLQSEAVNPYWNGSKERQIMNIRLEMCWNKPQWWQCHITPDRT